MLDFCQVVKKGGSVIRLNPVLAGMLFVFCLGIAAGLPDSAYANPDALQKLLDRAEPGSEVRLPAGKYQGPIVIDKPLTLRGEGEVEIVAGEKGAALTVQTNHSDISGITVLDNRKDPKAVAVSLRGNDNRLSRMTIRSHGYGIQMEKVHRNHLESLTIEGLDPDREMAMRGNGIDLWGAHDNRIRQCVIRNKSDGIYLESSENNRVEKNQVTGSRYGIHLMFTQDTKVLDNRNRYNISGIMVMGTERTVVRGNILTKQIKNVHSLGLLLYDVINAEVTENSIDENRVGILIQEAGDNRIYQNQVARNFIGVQLVTSKGNLITKNNMVSNVIQAQAERSKNNRIEHNFWDDHKGVDFNGDQKSELPYRADPFYLALTEKSPPFRLLFHSPGMTLMQDLLTTRSVKKWAADPEPLIRPAFTESDEKPSSFPPLQLWLVSALFLILGTVPLWVKGVIRT